MELCVGGAGLEGTYDYQSWWCAPNASFHACDAADNCKGTHGRYAGPNTRTPDSGWYSTLKYVTMEVVDTTTQGYATIFWSPDCTAAAGTVSIPNADNSKTEFTGSMMQDLNINPGHVASAMI